MNKAHSLKNWQNYPSINTPLNAKNLNELDISVDAMDDRIIVLDETKATKEEIAPLIKEISFDESVGIFTITRKNGSKFTIDTKLEKIAINFGYDPLTQQISLTLIDGTTQYIDLSALITEYEFLDTDTVSFFVDETGKVSAIVKEGSIEEKHLRPDYLAEIKIEAAKSQQSAINSETYAKQAQSYAVGVGNMRPNEASDNAKYYAEKAQESAEKAQEIVGRNYIPESEKGIAGGVASLDETGKIPKLQLPNDIESVTGVKGDSESEYRVGNVNLTPENIGALSLKKGGTIKNNFIVNKSSTTNSSGYVELEIKNDGKVSILRPDDSSISAKTDAAIYADKSFSSNGTRNDLVRINTNTLQFAGNHFLFAGSTTPNIGERLFEVSGELAQFYSHNGIRITNNTGSYGGDDIEARQQISMDVNGTEDIEIKSGNGAIRLNSSVPLYKHEFFLSNGNTDSYWKHYNGFNKTLPASITLGDFLRIYNNKIRLGRNSSNNAIQYDLDVAGNYDTLELKCFKNELDNTGIKLSGDSDDIKIKGNVVFYDVDNPNNMHTIEMTPSEHKIYSNTYNLNLQNLILIHDYNGYKVMYPNDSGQTDLGMTDRKWKNIYATNGVIQTSDRNEKNTIVDLTTEKAEALIYGLRPSTYKMNEGTSGRTHWGMISQDIEELLKNLGWTSKDFAGFIKSPKQVEITEDENGNKLEEPIIDTIENEYSYALRYDEFIAPLIKVVQAQNERILKLEEYIALNK